MSILETLRAVIGLLATAGFAVILAVEAWDAVQWRRFLRAVKARGCR